MQRENTTRAEQVTKKLPIVILSFIFKCNEIMNKLVGGYFAKASPDWLIDDQGTTYVLDSYCELFKIRLDFSGDYLLNLPESVQHSYLDIDLYAKIFYTYKNNVKNLCKNHNVFTIDLPEIIEDDILEDYLCLKLHEATKYKCFIALPLSTT